MKNNEPNKFFHDMQDRVVKRLVEYNHQNPGGYDDFSDLLKSLPPVDYVIPKIAPNSEIHHYTSIFALQNIITNSEFWLTRGDFLNDRQEVMYFGDSAIKLLEALKATGTMDEEFIISLQFSLSHYFSNIFSSQFYILSLALDNDSLGMWNYYGKNDGYCLSFQSDDFIRNLDQIIPVPVLHGAVNYNSDTLTAYLDNEISMFYNIWLEKDRNPYVLRLISFEIPLRWARYACFFKHPAFATENEYRVVIDTMSNGFSNYFSIQYRASRGIMLPYIKLKCAIPQESLRFPLTGVKVGPLINNENAIQGLKSWLLSLGFEQDSILISESDIPLRF